MSEFSHTERGMTRFPPNVEQVTVERSNQPKCGLLPAGMTLCCVIPYPKWTAYTSRDCLFRQQNLKSLLRWFQRELRLYG